MPIERRDLTGGDAGVWDGHLREHDARRDQLDMRNDAHLREHDLMLDQHQHQHEQERLAVEKVATNMEKRFDSVNEFREQQKDIIAGFLPRAEYDSAHAALIDRVDQFRATATGHITREEHNSVVKALSDRIKAVEDYRIANENKEKGAQPFMAIIISVVTAVLSALAVGAMVIATR